MGANADLVKLMGPELELLLPVLDEMARRLALGAMSNKTPSSLELPWAAAREQRLHLERGHSRRARTGPAAPFRYTLETRLPAAICHHRPGMPCSHIAALPGARHSTITPAVQAITNLPGSGHPALAPGPVRVRTPTDLRRHAAAAGITGPAPPPRGRLRK